MGIATDLARIKGNITAALAAIAEKGVTVPDGSTSDALAELIASIEAGGGGGIEIKSGTSTMAEQVRAYSFVNDKPDVFIMYRIDDTKPTYNVSNFIWALFQFKSLGKQYIFGYSIGTSKYYVPSYVKLTLSGAFNSVDFNSYLGAGVTYKWHAFYGGDI